MLFALSSFTGVKALGIDIEQEPYSVLHAEFSFSFCQRHLRSLLLSIPFYMNTREHTHSLPSRLPQTFEGFTYLCTFRTDTKTVLTPESIFILLHYNIYLLLLTAVP